MTDPLRHDCAVALCCDRNYLHLALFDVCKTGPEAVVPTDQSLTNLALRGGFALLAPCRNWQMNERYPLVPWRYPVFIRHFIGRIKPDRDSQGIHDARFNRAYRDFLLMTHMMPPEALPLLAPPCDPMPTSLSALVNLLLRVHRGAAILRQMLTRFADPYRAEI